MALFRRVPKLPADRRPPLERDERVLAWSPVADGVVVATTRGVWLPGRGRLGWHEINKAVWSGRELTVTPAERVQERAGYAVIADADVLTYLLVEPGDVPHQVRARVTRSVAYTAHHRLGAGGGVRVAARRVPGVDGLTWTVRFDPGTDPGHPGVDELVAEARAQATPAP
ncbi:hypothetical protein [Rhizomonospora bruguierae]|uniref:hypothetical protein n=1 Tax=Rhizomonospora bruguierae TaxID=1581705 RepID=UPI001BCBF3B9|nr:hypothetical protein [Micromonospora sp. NBRC 107566]